MYIMCEIQQSKFKKVNEVEIQRSNITPREFYWYCKKELKRKTGLSLEDWISYQDWVSPGPALKCETHKNEHQFDDGTTQVEHVKYQPYNMQIYVSDTYNVILEFDFWDDRIGCGYFYHTEYEEV